MTALLRLFTLPLLAKELTEAAARRRTYVLRVVYGLALFGVFAAIAPRWLWQGNYQPLEVMGAGRLMLENILMLQFVGIGLFLPATMCGRIAEEKERDSLVLLFLTDLGPWSIVLQKYLGGLVPMLSCLLLAMPLAAIAYAFGGVTTDALAAGLYALLLGCLQVGALALLCSAWCRTMVAALVSTYLLGAVFYGGPLILAAVSESFIPGTQWIESERNATLLIPPALFFLQRTSSWGLPASWVSLLAVSVPILISTLFFLTLARIFLVRRAFAPPASFFLRLFRRLDGVMQRANRLTGHRMLLREGRSLPDDDPIAWREMTRKALGKVHYLVRILVALELPVVALCALASLDGGGYRGQCDSLSMLAAIVGMLAVLAVSVQAANIIVAERVQQTLQVLLTTALTAREIVAQKAQVLRRFMFVVAVPLLTIFGTEAYLEAGLSGYAGMKKDGWPAYLAGALLTVGIYLPLVSWLSLWIGLKIRTRFKAILTALAVVVGWCVLPVVAAYFADTSGMFSVTTSRKVVVGLLFLLCPLAVPAFNEQSQLHNFPLFSFWLNDELWTAWLVLALNFTFYGALLLLFRRLALTRADRHLRR